MSKAPASWTLFCPLLFTLCVGCAGVKNEAPNSSEAERCYQEMFEIIDSCNRVEIEYSDDVRRISPFVVEDPTALAALKAELRRATEFAPMEEKRRFTETMAGVETRLTWVARKPYVRFARTRLSGFQLLLFPESERSGAMLPDDTMWKLIGKLAEEHGKQHPSDVLSTFH